MIKEELTEPPKKIEIVLKAKPTQYYHEIQRIAAEKKAAKMSQSLAAKSDQPNNRSKTKTALKKSQIPVIQAKTSKRALKSRFDFTPLPQMNSITEDDLTVESTSEISDQVYDPNEFPLIEPLHKKPDASESTIPLFVTELPKLTEPETPIEQLLNKRSSILLRAVPDRTKLDIQEMQLQKKSQAKFQFIQPGYQKVIDEIGQ